MLNEYGIGRQPPLVAIKSHASLVCREIVSAF